jgi:2-C-methyl-D-erythritol 4-phosphate cytidylyltransferase
MKKAVIIVAAGQGLRMNSAVPKQFMELNGQPILMHTIKRFHEYQNKILVIVVLPENEIKNWKELVQRFSFPFAHEVVTGGSKRFYSVLSGLHKIKDSAIVAIHDGVRPFCSVELIDRCFKEAEKKSNAIPAVKITETIREIKNDTSFIVNRENFRCIQTPQCFDVSKLKEAYLLAEKAGEDSFTDDAGVFEFAGNKINLIEGEKNNIKITVEEDLILASVIGKKYFN